MLGQPAIYFIESLSGVCGPEQILWQHPECFAALSIGKLDWTQVRVGWYDDITAALQDMDMTQVSCWQSWQEHPSLHWHWHVTTCSASQHQWPLYWMTG